jgi:hypothetical protein
MGARLEGVSDEDVSKLHAEQNNILVDVILGKMYRNFVINGIYIIPATEFKNKYRKSPK